MGTLTDYLGLYKPDLTDSADITAMNGNWNTIDQKLFEIKKRDGGIIVTKGEDGLVGNTYCNKYTATIEGIDELSDGLEIMVIPNEPNSQVNICLNVNGLGDKPVVGRSLYDVIEGITPKYNAWFAGHYPMKLTYRTMLGGMWVSEFVVTPSPISRINQLFVAGYYYLEFYYEEDFEGGVKVPTTVFSETFYWEPGLRVRRGQDYELHISPSGNITALLGGTPYGGLTRFERIM